MRLRAPRAALAGVAALTAAVPLAWRASRGANRISLDRRVALVTGASRGLGLALSRELARRGARLVLCARDEDHLMGAAAELEAAGAEVLARSCDVSDVEQVQALVDAALERFGGLDLVINNAGVIAAGPMECQRLEDYRLMMDVMFWGVVHPTLAALPHLRERPGARVVNITSIGAIVSAPHLVPYGAAKFAARGFSEGIRAELADAGVAVTTVYPGLMRTGSHRNALFKGRQEAEYTWFALAATNPAVSTSAERAARRIADAAERGDPTVLLGISATLAMRAQGLFPTTVQRALGLADRLLPGAEGGSAVAEPGREHETAVTRSPLTALGRSAAEDLRQHVRKD